VDTEYGRKRAELEPANEQLAKVGIVQISARRKAADVGCPIWKAGKREVQAGGNLALETQPVGEHITRPSSHTIALRPAKAERDKIKTRF